MPVYASTLMFGFPLRRVGDVSIRKQYNLPDRHWFGDGVLDWCDRIAANVGIPVVEKPGPGLSITTWNAYVERVEAVVKETGCTIYPAGDCESRHNDFFVAALILDLPQGPDKEPFRCVPSFALDMQVFDRLKRFAKMLGVPYELPSWHLVDRYRNGY